MFQSSIAPKSDRNLINQSIVLSVLVLFQSSIAPKSDRNVTTITAIIPTTIGSNPRSPRRAIAILFNACGPQSFSVPILDRPEERSQSSAAPKAHRAAQVPILDRPEERSQYAFTGCSVCV